MGQEMSANAPPMNIGGKEVRMVRKIAEGGFSFVYLVEDCQTCVRYALKRCVANDRVQDELIKKEIALMKSLTASNSPHFVKYYGSVSKKSQGATEYYILMEFCAQGSLINRLQATMDARRRTPEIEIVLITEAILKGLKHMHSMDPPLAHRDIKIENVLIDDHGQFKICDLGSATDRGGIFMKTPEMNAEADIIAKHSTEMYRSPELCDLYRAKLNNWHIGPKADIWALGSVLYMLAYFTHPFEEGGVLAILSGKVDIPTVKGYSKYLNYMISRCYTMDPTVRPSADEMLRLCQLWKGYLQTKQHPDPEIGHKVDTLVPGVINNKPPPPPLVTNRSKPGATGGKKVTRPLNNVVAQAVRGANQSKPSIMSQNYFSEDPAPPSRAKSSISTIPHYQQTSASSQIIAPAPIPVLNTQNSLDNNSGMAGLGGSHSVGDFGDFGNCEFDVCWGDDEFSTNTNTNTNTKTNTNTNTNTNANVNSSASGSDFFDVFNPPNQPSLQPSLSTSRQPSNTNTNTNTNTNSNIDTGLDDWSVFGDVFNNTNTNSKMRSGEVTTDNDDQWAFDNDDDTWTSAATNTNKTNTNTNTNTSFSNQPQPALSTTSQGSQASRFSTQSQKSNISHANSFYRGSQQSGQRNNPSVSNNKIDSFPQPQLQSSNTITSNSGLYSQTPSRQASGVNTTQTSAQQRLAMKKASFASYDAATLNKMRAQNQTLAQPAPVSNTIISGNDQFDVDFDAYSTNITNSASPTYDDDSLDFFSSNVSSDDHGKKSKKNKKQDGTDLDHMFINNSTNKSKNSTPSLYDQFAGDLPKNKTNEQPDFLSGYF